jgi:hypothetical protein
VGLTGGSTERSIVRSPEPKDGRRIVSIGDGGFDSEGALRRVGPPVDRGEENVNPGRSEPKDGRDSWPCRDTAGAWAGGEEWEKKGRRGAWEAFESEEKDGRPELNERWDSDGRRNVSVRTGAGCCGCDSRARGVSCRVRSGSARRWLSSDERVPRLGPRRCAAAAVGERRLPGPQAATTSVAARSHFLPDELNCCMTVPFLGPIGRKRGKTGSERCPLPPRYRHPS